VPTEEGTHGLDADTSRERTGPRHAAPKKPLLARLHMPAGKAIALAAMPTVLVGMGLTTTLARAEGQQPVSKSLTAEEYQACVEAMAKEEPTASPSPSASESSASGDEKKDSGKSGSASDSGSDDKSSAGQGSEDKGDGDKAVTPSPSPSASDGKTEGPGGDAAASPSPSPSASASASEESKGLLEVIGDTLKDVFTGGGGETPSASPSATPSASPDAAAEKGTTGKKAADTAEDTKKESPAASATAPPSPSPSASESSPSDSDDGDKKADASPSPSPSASTDVDDCPDAATDAESGIDNKMRLPDDPWYLNASGLTLKGADYQGIVKVKTANGSVKEVLKYVISGGTDIDDLHQTVIDKQAGKTYHVKGAKGSKSTITGGKTIMYTESISGNLLGLIPVTFSPKSPPPLNIPLIYFSNVKVVQAGQFGGTLHIPGMSQSIT